MLSFIDARGLLGSQAILEIKKKLEKNYIPFLTIFLDSESLVLEVNIFLISKGYETRIEKSDRKWLIIAGLDDLDDIIVYNEKGIWYYLFNGITRKISEGLTEEDDLIELQEKYDDDEVILLDNSQLIVNDEVILLDNSQLIVNDEVILLDNSQLIVNDEVILLDNSQLIVNDEVILLDNSQLIDDDEVILLDNSQLINKEKCSELFGFETVVMVSSRFMGEDNKDLGEKLAIAFFDTLLILNEKNEKNDFIVLYNSAVWLSCSNSNIYSSLKALEAKGATIISCEICLKYYNLLNELKVGRVGNMFEIIEAQKKANKVIRM